MARKRVVRRPVRRYFSRAVRHAKKMTVSLAVLAGLAPGVVSTVNAARAGGIGMGAQVASAIYTGFDFNGHFNVGPMKQGLLPLIGGMVVHKLAGMIGINRAIAGTGIPFIRI